MIPISNIIEKEKEKLTELKINLKSRQINISISAKDFKELFLIQVNQIIAERNINREFEQKKDNSKIINQIFFYTTGNPKFEGKLEKGILLIGKNGVGKTLILRAYCSIIALLTNKRITYIHSKKLQSEIRTGNIENFEKKPILIDDIGKESKEVNDFGTKILPIADLMALRYDNGSLTFATCNYNLETLAKFYGKTTTDRFKEMFNIFKLEGESYRE